MASVMALVNPVGELHMEAEEVVEVDLAAVLEPVVLGVEEAQEEEEEAVVEVALEGEEALVEISEKILEKVCESQAGIKLP